ncbi:MFS general substrate transporter [Saccharata proteae CBS 121410]|uniref:MFS general substrate transporter n=1 Tax=Saccharata proteae CBS 121410 TaxID=1314787 RepID=A0A9P4HWR8_9PEZI|nr:MFS general substrate transporter [Saccharata proteae CBS 121410]
MDDVEKVHQSQTLWNEDPSNPRNWTLFQRNYHTFMAAMICFSISFSSTVYIPGSEHVATEFDVSRVTSILPFSLFVLGMSFGPIIGAPLSESLGRRPVYLASVPGSALFLIGAGFSKSVSSLAVCRFLAGLIGSPALAISAGGTVADLWAPEDRLLPLSLMLFGAFVGPALGTLVGGFVASARGWRWTIWTALFLSAATTALIILMRETYHPAIMKRQDRKRTGFTNQPRLSLLVSRNNQSAMANIFRPIHMLISEPVVISFSFYTGVNFAVIYGFYASIPYTFAKTYDFNLQSQGLVFAAIVAGCAIAVPSLIYSGLLSQRVLRRSHLPEERGKQRRPEDVLFPAMVASPFLPTSLFWFGWSAEKHVHWICPVIAIAVYGWATFLVFNSCLFYLINVYGHLYGASAAAANRLLSLLLGIAFPLFALPMYRNLGVGWASSLLGFMALILVPMPWIFYKHGAYLTAVSSYTRST